MSAAGPLARDLDASMGEAFPHIRCSGAGSEASPFTAADDTAGIASEVSSGAVINLGPKRYDLTETVEIRVRCNVVGSGEHPQHPGAFTEPIAGTRLKGFDIAFRVGDGTLSPDTRPNSIALERFSLWGKGITYSAGSGEGEQEASGCGILVDEPVDQLKLDRISFHRCFWGLRFDHSSDASRLTRLNFAGCAVAIYVPAGNPFWCHNSIVSNIIADNEATAVVLMGNGDLTRNNKLIDNTFVYNAHNVAYGDPAHVLWGMDKGQILGNNFWQAGRDSDTGPIPADGLIITGSDNLVSGNTFEGQQTAGATANGTAYAAGIVLRSGAARNKITGNIYRDNTVDVYVAAGAVDNVIDEPQGIVVTDNGTRTRVNGVSRNAGDPNSTGDWNGIAKPDGLTIHDTTNDVAWLYHSAFDNGRIRVNPGSLSIRGVLSGVEAITEADGTYQQIKTVTATEAGRYLVLATVQAFVSSSGSANPSITAKLRNVTTSTDLDAPALEVVYGATVGTQYSASSCLHAVATLAANDVVGIFAASNAGGTYNNRGVQSQGTHLQLVRLS